MTAQTIPVAVPGRRYDVHVGPGLLDQVPVLLSRALGGHSPRRVVVISDTHVGPLYAGRLVEALGAAALPARELTFPAGEEHKDLPTYCRLVEDVLSSSPPIDRGSVVVALGGGVVGDLAGFVAATVLRGLAFVNVPTTLLADVDASVGGKTGVDVAAGKNLVGAFHQPRLVAIDTALLRTLPAQQLRSGLAECVKHGVIREPSLLEYLRSHRESILSADAEVLAELVARNVRIKAAVVSADERESNVRAHLNFGHTVGHAVETAAGYGVISHGQCVALGMVAAFKIAVGRKLATAAEADTVGDLLRGLGLPVAFGQVGALPAQACEPPRLEELMRRDKKARAGVVRFVLPVGLGRVELFDDVTTAEVRRALDALAGR